MSTSQPDLPPAHHGRARVCRHCGTRVAQKAQTCFFCGQALDAAPQRRIHVPWADLFLFAVIGAVLALWWLRAPEAPNPSQSDQLVLPADGTDTALIALVSAELPTATPTPLPTPTPPTPTLAPEPTATVPAGPVRHTVVSGDSVAAIAQKYGSTIKDIIQANGLSADGRLSVGQALIIPIAGPSGGPGPTATAQGDALMYVVKSGDTISAIAERYRSQIAWILAANKLNPTDFLRVGQSLLIPLAALTPTLTPTVAFTPQTPTPTLEPTLGAPVLLSPADGSILTGQSEVVLNWMAPGTLEADEWYVVTLRAGEVDRPVATWWTKSTTWRLPLEYRGASRAGIDFNWQVQVHQGSAENPGVATSPASARRRFTWQ